MSASIPVLRVRGLMKRFTMHNVAGRVVESLRGIDVDVDAGEHVAVAGTSGAGKSSLLKCVYRSYVPTAGSITFTTGAGDSLELTSLDDQAMAGLREQEIGYVSQFLRAEPRRSALEVVTRAGVRRGMDVGTAGEAAADALRRVNIDEHLWASYPSVLSGGERQRVNLAAGTIKPPRLLLLDEPVSALDPVNREAVLAMIADLAHAGVAVLGVFHDLDAMRRLATRVIVLDHGRIARIGPPDDVLTDVPTMVP